MRNKTSPRIDLFFSAETSSPRRSHSRPAHLQQQVYNNYVLTSTAGVMKTVPSVYTLFMNTVYVSTSSQVAGETVFGNHTVFR